MSSKVYRFGLLIIAVAFIFTACNKDKRNAIHIEAKVFDPNTNIAVVGANVTISASKLNTGGIFSSGYEDIATTTTDASGTFIFDFQEERFAGYKITIAKEKYFGNIIELTTSDIVPGTTFSTVYNIYPECFIKLKVQNVINYDSTDHIAYSFTAGYVNCYECCDNTIYQGHGLNYSNTIACKTYGNQNVTATYNITRDGSTMMHTVSHYCNAFDTTTFTISY
ncbi:MAG: hypothetical protein WCQ95_05350 [Bacteroidota bacterium]